MKFLLSYYQYSYDSINTRRRLCCEESISSTAFLAVLPFSHHPAPEDPLLVPKVSRNYQPLVRVHEMKFPPMTPLLYIHITDKES